MIKNINVYVLIKVLFILTALIFIVVLRAEYHQMDARDRLDELESYFTPLALQYMAIRLLSFGVLFAACFNLKAAKNNRLHVNKKRFIFGMILLLVSLVDYQKLLVLDYFNSGIGIKQLFYIQSTDYLTLLVSALSGSLCCRSFKIE